MFQNYLKISLRNIRKYKGYSFINVAGLAVSIASCMLIGLWITNELSYDKHYPDQDRIAAILVHGYHASPNALAPYLQENVPEIEYAARITHGGEEVLVNYGEISSFEKIVSADATIIEILSFPFVAGDSKHALDDPNSIVLTQEFAARYFPHTDAVGQTLLVNNEKSLTVTGVIENPPPNSKFQFNLLTSIEYQRQPFVAAGFDYDSFRFWSTRTVVKMRPGVTAESLTGKIAELIQDQYEDRAAELSAINISDLYLRFSQTRNTIKVFSAIAIAILLMACINFINLSTARYRTRAKETAMRKIIGASRGVLVLQFLGESIFLMLIGVVVALGLVELALPYFNAIFGLRLSLALFYNTWVIAVAAAVFGITALATGIYPAMVLSRFNPVQTLRIGRGSAGKQFNLRRVLVVIQFALTAILIVGTVVIYAQVNYMKSWDVGYDKEHVINIQLRGDSQKQLDVLKSELLKNPDIVAVTAGTASLPYWDYSTTSSWDGLNPDEEIDVGFNYVKFDFAKTFGIQFVEGRDFDKNYSTDLTNACVINETLAKMMNQPVTLGSRLNIWEEDRTVVGVMKDFNFHPLNEEIGPLALMMVPVDGDFFQQANLLSIRISPDHIEPTIGYVGDTWNRILPNHPFEYTFLDQEFDANYRSIEQINNLAVSFGLLAVFIASLGLFGLASYTAEQRTKEIGIRKVLGATVVNIVRMMSKEYVVLVGLANLVAWPLGWYFMENWLSDFAYRIDIGFGVFLMVGGFTLLIALASVGYQALRAATTNPVDAIQYE